MDIGVVNGESMVTGQSIRQYSKECPCNYGRPGLGNPAIHKNKRNKNRDIKDGSLQDTLRISNA